MAPSAARDREGTLVLPYGTTGLPLSQDKSFFDNVLESKVVPRLADPKSQIAEALLRPIGASPLRELAKGRKNACLVVSDKTRPVPYPAFLPHLLSELQKGGLPLSSITLLIATGMHEPTEAAEFGRLYGELAASGCRIVNHDCRDRGNLREVARIEGHPVELNSLYLDADLKILTGMVEPHAFAGFSGGGKSVLPGLASLETMKFMHSYALVERLDDALGRVEGNPFRDYIDMVVGKAGGDFTFNVLINRAREISGVFAGDPVEAFHLAARAAGEFQILPVEEQADAVITTGGGDPLDRTFYQACKGFINASAFLKPGGTLLFAARCADGLGSPGFCEAVRKPGSKEAFRRCFENPANFTTDQWAAQAYYRRLDRIGKPLLYSEGVGREDAGALGLEKVDSFGETLLALRKTCEKIFLVPEGPYVMGRTYRH